MDTYDRSGNAITIEEWGLLFQRKGYCRVDHTSVVEGVSVSTVWLGMDHGHDGGVPVIFESMVFGGQHDNYCERYTAETEAKGESP
jgi:hypothetical protein